MLALAAGSLGAQLPGSDPTPTIRAVRTDARIRLDGVPDEPAWLTTDSITDWHQKDPAEGERGTQRTVVRVLATDAGLYVAAWMDDPRPDALVHARLRRDDDIESEDYIALLFDSQRDRRTGYLFGTNPNGMLWDGEVNAENLDTDWNGVWDVRTRITPFGWTAEFFIPWQNFRAPAGAESFGFNVERLMRRTNEKVLWRS